MISFTIRKWIVDLSVRSNGEGFFRIWLKGWRKDEYLQAASYKVVGKTVVLGDIHDIFSVSRKVINIDDIAMIEDGTKATIEAGVDALPPDITKIMKSIKPGQVFHLTDGMLRGEKNLDER